ncbi:hypothetical protein ES703_118606 [subsurface metagenome]
MHAAAIDAENRLGHEGSINSVFQGYLLDHQTVGHHVVSHGQGISVPHVYLVLAGGNLMVGILNTNTHLLQVENRLFPQVSGGI